MAGSTPPEPMMSLGILSLLDPEVLARHEASKTEEQKQRDYAISRVMAVYSCKYLDALDFILETDDAAREWYAAGIPKEMIN